MKTEEPRSAEELRKLATDVLPKNVAFIEECLEEARKQASLGKFECFVGLCSEVERKCWAGAFSRKLKHFFWLKFFPSLQLEIAILHLTMMGYSVQLAEWDIGDYMGSIDMAGLWIRW